MHLIFAFFLSPLMWSQSLSFHRKVASIAFLLILFVYCYIFLPDQAKKHERRLSLKSFYVISCWLTTVSDMLHDVVELHRMISDSFWGKRWEWSCLDSIEAHGMPQYDMLSRNLLTRLRQQKKALGGFLLLFFIVSGGWWWTVDRLFLFFSGFTRMPLWLMIPCWFCFTHCAVWLGWQYQRLLRLIKGLHTGLLEHRLSPTFLPESGSGSCASVQHEEHKPCSSCRRSCPVDQICSRNVWKVCSRLGAQETVPSTHLVRVLPVQTK